MTTRKQALSALQKFKNESGSKYGIISIGLFGSVARNQATEESDVDVVVETERADAFQIVHIKETLEEQLNTHVDIVRKRDRMNEFLKARIEEEAVYV